MSQSFEDVDLQGAVFWGVNLRDATFRDVDLSGATTHHVLLKNVELDGLIDRLVVNGVDVTDFVNANDPWQPLRGMLEPTTADGVRAAWAEVEAVWDATIETAAERTEEDLNRSVNGEWSFVETLRHVVFAVDKWFTGPIMGGEWQPLGIPNTGSVDFAWPTIDPNASPTLGEVLAARQAQAANIRSSLGALTDDDLVRSVEVLENGTVAVLQCWHVVFEESFEHRRYALRDLAQL
ncbi:MAG: DinB family protein [Acidimicrobiales bacterium]